MSEVEFQEARNRDKARRDYIRNFNVGRGAKFVTKLTYVRQDVWVPFIGYAAMMVPWNTGYIDIYPYAFESPFVRKEDDFRSLLVDHEITHVKENKSKPRNLLNRVSVPEGRYNGDISLLEHEDEECELEYDEGALRRIAYRRLHPGAEREVRAYENQMKKIKACKRQCSDEFIALIQKRLAIYRGVL